VHRGPYDGLYDANAVLIGWARKAAASASTWRSLKRRQVRLPLEIYRTDPRKEPDPANFETEVAIRVADAN
jgi:effector-binding domain-containing protein